MAEESDLEKTEEPTSKRLEKARTEGNVPRSLELSTFLILMSAAGGFAMFGANLNQALMHNLSSSLAFNRDVVMDATHIFKNNASPLMDLIVAFAPIAILLFLIAMFSPILIGGWNISTEALMPKFSRMNPISGMSNIISKNSIVELIKAMLKALLVGVFGYLVVTHYLMPMLALSSTRVDEGVIAIGHMLTNGLLLIVSALAVITFIDVPYQLKKYIDKLKMTKEEVRQESKETEGNPEIKARVRQQQREMARRRMMSEIPNADVIITNPTHYAVAIQYKEGMMGAPKVIAKGADEVALKIREIAKNHQIMTLESPKLARAVYAHTELGEEIPAALYGAVAEILAYVFQVRIFNEYGGAYPNTPTNVDVPDALDPHLNQLEAMVSA